MWVYFLKLRYEVFNEFKKIKALVEKESGCCITTLKFDNGSEFVQNNSMNFVLNLESKDSSLHPTLHNRMEWLRGETIPSHRWPSV
jgi:hypothetical protein